MSAVFELIVAWSVFTFLIGKTTESVVHAVKGTTPPGHQARMERLRAKYGLPPASDTGGGGGPARTPQGAAKKAAAAPSARRAATGEPGGARGYFAGLWGDHWDLRAQKHADRWPAKAERARQRARERTAARRQAFEEIEDRAAQRWERRRGAEREPAERGPVFAEIGRTARRWARYAGAKAPRRGDPDTPDTPDTAGDGAGQTGDGPDTGPGHGPTPPGQPQSEAEPAPGPAGEPGSEPDPQPASDADPAPGAGPDEAGNVIAFPQPDSQGEQMPSTDTVEVLNLNGATRFTEALVASYDASAQRLEEVVAQMGAQDMQGGPLYQQFTAIQAATADMADMAREALETCRSQQLVADAVIGAGPDAMSKDALTRD